MYKNTMKENTQDLIEISSSSRHIYSFFDDTGRFLRLLVENRNIFIKIFQFNEHHDKVKVSEQKLVISWNENFSFLIVSSIFNYANYI